jgi:hypothetical protein
MKKIFLLLLPIMAMAQKNYSQSLCPHFGKQQIEKNICKAILKEQCKLNFDVLLSKFLFGGRKKESVRNSRGNRKTYQKDAGAERISIGFPFNGGIINSPAENLYNWDKNFMRIWIP